MEKSKILANSGELEDLDVEIEGQRILGRIITEGYNDFQRIRIASANRIRDIIRKRVEGIEFSSVEPKKEEKNYEKKYSDKVLFEKLDLVYAQNRIPKTEYKYLMRCKEIMDESINLEAKYKRVMLDLLPGEEIYTCFLHRIKGIGPVLSAKLIKALGDCSTFNTVSKLWAYCGLSVVNGIAPKREKGKKLKFNPKMRALMWNVSTSLLKQNKACYREIYDSEKEKQRAKIYEAPYLFEKYGDPYKKTDTTLSKGHIHNRCLRKMGKIFLDHFWHVARELNSLPAEKNYVEGILQHNHIITWQDAIKREEVSQNE